MTVGIEDMNAFVGSAFVNVQKLAEHRGLEGNRLRKLLVDQKSIAMPDEDPVTFAVNAAKPIINALSEKERNSIELVITGSESSFDFGKSLSTYVHDLLGLNRNCRLFEIKNACYSGVAGLQMAVNTVLSKCSPGGKALVVAADISRFVLDRGVAADEQEWAYAEPTGGAGAVAMLIGDEPRVLSIDVGASGCYGFEVMDTCRPTLDSDSGDPDLSLLSYLECCEKSFLEYCNRVDDVNYKDTFKFLSFHTPFGGMVKGAHRNMSRKFLELSKAEVEEDFQRRVAPGLEYCKRTGNMMGATTMYNVLSTIENGEFDAPERIGVFSYGSGCCSEFFSGVVSEEAPSRIGRYRLLNGLESRHQLSMQEYDAVLSSNAKIKFGTKDLQTGEALEGLPKRHRKGEIRLKEIKDFHRCYEWC